jgi:hypothetical protein
VIAEPLDRPVPGQQPLELVAWYGPRPWRSQA